MTVHSAVLKIQLAVGKWEIAVYSYMHEGKPRPRFLLETVFFQVSIRKKGPTLILSSGESTITPSNFFEQLHTVVKIDTSGLNLSCTKVCRAL